METAVTATRARPVDPGRYAAMERLQTLIRGDVDETICCGQAQAEHWFRVVSGAARRCSLTADGRRQIVDFLLPGDAFGFDARAQHECSAEVVTSGTTIARYPRRAVEDLAESDLQVSKWLREMAFDSIARLQARTLILGHGSALARVSAFLLDWADRCDPGRNPAISLPMSRYDIADYLAIAVETVSRTLTVLRTRHVIAFRATRRFNICDRRALELATEGGDEPLLAN
jgi:CRP/FNR family nitrogen fixation transcriptional regulator